MASTKKVVTKKVVKKAVKKAVVTKKKIGKSSAISQSVLIKAKQPKAVVTTTSKSVDTSTPVNKWVKEVRVNHEFELEPFGSHVVPKEHRMFEVDNVEKEGLKMPFWARLLWWFVKSE